MSIINSLQNWMAILLATLIIVIFAVGIAMYYLLKIKKVAAEEEVINYDSFTRVDSREYCKFSDIVSSGPNSIGVIDIGNNTFVGGIDITGYNFFSASADERQRTMINMIAFFNALEEPIQMRQSVRGIDISYNLNKEKELAKKIEYELLDLNEAYEAGVASMEEYIDDDNTYAAIETQVKKILHSIQSKRWQLQESKEIVYWMEHVSSVETNMRKVNQIMFSYVYNPDEDIEELSRSEIILKAEKELQNKAQILGNALENCGCSWKVLSADDLVGLLRSHYHPATADSVKIRDLLNSSYSSLYVSSDSLRELEMERLGDIQYEQQVKEMERLQEEQRRRAERMMERERNLMIREARASVAQ